MDNLSLELQEIIRFKRLEVLFQPIVSLKSKSAFGFEALIRGPADSPMHLPLSLFEAADSCGLTLELEQTCREVILREYARQEITGKLFLNVSPQALLQAEPNECSTLHLMQRHRIPTSRVVIEITEQQPTDRYDRLRRAIGHFREAGFQIALDDLGAGYSGLRLWTELMPDFVKIDRHFIRDIDSDPVKLNFVQSIQNMAQASDCGVIAEGIETSQEFRSLEQLGIKLMQGYFFARPAKTAAASFDESLLSAQSERIEPVELSLHSTLIREITNRIPPIPRQTNNQDVLQMFQKNRNLQVLPVVEGDVPCGLIYKDHFLSRLFTSRYGIELFGNKPVTEFIDTAPLMFDHQDPVETVSQHITRTVRTDSAFIITENGRYFGIATLMDLLQVITTQQIQHARHSNPLTLLPGMAPTNQIIDDLLLTGTSFCIAYVDLDHFKPFNDLYGYEKGDQVILGLAELLKCSVKDGAGTVGHIGGDDFIVVLTARDWESRCRRILRGFASLMPNYYSSEHLYDGGIKANDRNGHPCFYPLLSVSIGLLGCESTRNCRSHLEIADLATEAKHHAKMTAGNSYFINRRSRMADAKLLNAE